MPQDLPDYTTIINQANLNLVAALRLTKTWLPAEDPAEGDEQDAEEWDKIEEAQFKARTEYAGLGYIPPPEPANPYAKSSTSTKTKLGSKAEDAATEALRKRLTGKKGQARVVPLNKSRPVGTHTPSTPKPRPAVPVLEEDEEEEGRSGLGNAKRKREVEVEVKGKRMDGDGESGEDSADDLRGKKSALSYMDELLQEKRRKKKKKKKKSKVDVAM